MLILSYDISETKVRSAFSKFIKKNGRRLQFSVYEIDNSPRILNLILNEIEHDFAKRFASSDSIIIFSLCGACTPKIIRYGYAVQEEQELVII